MHQLSTWGELSLKCQITAACSWSSNTGKNIESQLFFVDFRVEPDPSKAVKLSVTFDSKAACVVGELLPGRSHQTCINSIVRSYRGFLVSNICLVSESDSVSEYWKWIAKLTVPRNLIPMYWILFVRWRFQKLKIKTLPFWKPIYLQIFYPKTLKVHIYEVSQALLIYIQYDTLSVRSRMLMRKNVKNDVSKHRFIGWTARLH